ncbi:MAG: hypothetical protein ACOVMN_08880 [Flexibacteraceae bacterium]
MEPNFSLETNALRYIYTEKLVVFQDARDSLLREIDFTEPEDIKLPTIQPQKPVEATVVKPEIEKVVQVETSAQGEPVQPPVENPKVVAPSVAQNLVIHGSNKRNILVLLPGLKTELTTEERDFLLKIMASKQLKGNDIGFVFENENRGITTKNQLLGTKPQLIIAFGVKYNFLAFLPSRSYSLIAEDSVLYLKSDSLLKLTTDSSLKKQLWSQLQPLVLA